MRISLHRVGSAAPFEPFHRTDELKAAMAQIGQPIGKETAPVASGSASAPALRRELGKWDLTAIGINQVIGSAVFILPSQLAAQVGNWGPIAFVAVGFASLLVALCFAEVGSRFRGTGGAYLYARAAF